jgi:hypothetical protein
MRTWGQIRHELQKYSAGVDLQLVNNWINGAYDRILGYRAWKELELEAWLETVDAYLTGTVTVTLGSTAVTGSGTTFTALMTGRKFRVDGRKEWYTFTRTGATTGTIERAYEGPSGSALPFHIFQNVYELPENCEYILVMTNQRVGRPMHINTRRELENISPARLAYGEPDLYFPSSESPEASPPVLHRVELYPIPLVAGGYPYTYKFIPTGFTGQNTSASPLPFVSDDAIAAFSKASILRHLKDGAGALAEEAQGLIYLMQMSTTENDRVGPVQIRMQQRFVRHRQRRWMRG